MVFLILLLCLESAIDLSAQYCVSLKYDNNGNRIFFQALNCNYEFRQETADDTKDEEMSEHYEEDDLSVYPNPNDGKFKVKAENEGNVMGFQVFDNKGVLIRNGMLVEEADIDITNHPAGVYLLRIIKDDGVYSRMVLKL